jgi:hypothetical protein
MTQNITKVKTDDQDTKHNNSTNTIRMQHLTTVLTDDQHTKHSNSTNRQSRYKT